MSELILSGVKIKTEYQDQVLNMGGPIIGSLTVMNKFISDKCVLDNFIFEESKKLLFFVKFHVITKYYFYFTINFYDLEHELVYEFEKEFYAVFLKKVLSPSMLEIHHAFHDAFPKYSAIFDLNEESFILL